MTLSQEEFQEDEVGLEGVGLPAVGEEWWWEIVEGVTSPSVVGVHSHGHSPMGPADATVEVRPRRLRVLETNPRAPS